MPYRKTDRELGRLAQRREGILDTACLTVQESGFGGAKARAVAAAAGVSVGSLYSHFEGIEGLHGEVFRRLAERELRRVGADLDRAAADGPAAALATLVRGFGLRCLHAPVQAWALLLEPVGPVIESLRLQYRRDYADLAASVIRDGVGAGAFAPQAVDVSAPAVIGAISESLVRPLSPGVRGDPGREERLGVGGVEDGGGVEDARGGVDADGGVDANSIEDMVALCLRAVGARVPA